MGILTRLRNAFGRSRKTQTAEAEGAARTAAAGETGGTEGLTSEDTGHDATLAPAPPAPDPKVPSPSKEPNPTPSASVPEPRTSDSGEHDLVSAAFDNVAVPRPTRSTEGEQTTAPERPDAGEPTGAEESAGAEKATAEKPAATEEPAAAEKAAAEKPAVAEEPAVVAEPTAVEEPEAAEKAVAEPPVAKKAADAEAAPAQTPVAEEPAVTDEATAEKPEPKQAAAAPATAEEPESTTPEKPESSPADEAQSEPAATTDAKKTTDAKTAAESDAAAEGDTKAEAKPEPQAETPAEPKPEPTPEPEPTAKAEPTPEPEPKPAADAKPKAEPKAEPKATRKVAPKAKTNAAGSAAKADQGTKSEKAPEPAAADGDTAPQGPPAPGDESSTGGAGGKKNTAEAAGEAAGEADPALTLTALKKHAPGLTTAYKAATTTLEKNNLTGTRAKVYLVLDRSASMRPYYKDGSAQALAEQTLALAAHLDPEATVPVVFFSTELDGTGEITLTEHENKIDDLHASFGRMGRTSYHAAVEAVLAHHDKTAEPTTPALVIFQTDGAPDAKTPATQALTDAAKTHPAVFFSFVAFGDPENKAFDYLRKLKTPNTSHFLAGETPRELTDTELYEGVLASWRP
ncbi:VWA domain-containing protein [Streptomyces tibetensis]|uniref:VWA domain-containing protein n=1 Tax=Streptomyces tibetensis TaxID=2382123 RepID=A0ABW6MVM4_9ACTN